MTGQRKEDAMDIVQRLEQDIAGFGDVDVDSNTEKGGADKRAAGKLLGYLTKRFSGVNPKSAVSHVRNLRANHPELTTEELVERLIKAKCQKTAAIGAGTSAASLVPGLGTAISLTVGLAIDIGSTLKLHSELVLEIAEAHGHCLTERQRSEVLLAVTGFSTGIRRLSGKAVKGLSQKAGELAGKKWLAKAVPALGMAASASTNVLSTYLIGKRADTYFVRGPEALGDVKDNLRALTGVDERKIAQWSSETSRTVAEVSAKTGDRLVEGGRRGAGHIADAGRKVGQAVSSVTDKVVDTGKTTGSAILSGTGDAAVRIADAGRSARATLAEKTAKAVNSIRPQKTKKDDPTEGHGKP